jgi:glycogen operon protein
LSAEQRELLELTRKLIDLRRTQPVFRRRHFFHGRPIHGTKIKDLYWLKEDGNEMSNDDWQAGHVRCLGMVLPGDQIIETGEQGERIIGDSFAILLNADQAVSFRLGARRRDLRWKCILDTAADSQGRTFEHMSMFPLQARSLAVLQAELSLPDKETSRTRTSLEPQPYRTNFQPVR